MAAIGELNIFVEDISTTGGKIAILSYEKCQVTKVILINEQFENIEMCLMNNNLFTNNIFSSERAIEYQYRLLDKSSEEFKEINHLLNSRYVETNDVESLYISTQNGVFVCLHGSFNNIDIRLNYITTHSHKLLLDMSIEIDEYDMFNSEYDEFEADYGVVQDEIDTVMCNTSANTSANINSKSERDDETDYNPKASKRTKH